MYPTYQLASTNDSVVSGSGTSAIATYAAVPNFAHVISGVSWSYSASPTGGSIKIEDGSGNVIFFLDITTAGPNYIPFVPAKQGSTNTAMIVTLASGGGAIIAKLSIIGHWIRQNLNT